MTKYEKPEVELIKFQIKEDIADIDIGGLGSMEEGVEDW